MFGEDAFRMKLDAPEGEFAVADSHDLAFFGFGGDFQAVRQIFSVND